MSLLSVVGKILNPVSAIIDMVDGSSEGKTNAKVKLLEVQAQMAAEMEKAIAAEVTAKSSIIVAEMQQGDLYTKRARPTVVYAGLAVLFVNHVVLPWVAHFAGMTIPEIEIPTAFWAGWSGIVTTWVIGRSAERRGANNKVIEMITGSK